MQSQYLYIDNINGGAQPTNQRRNKKSLALVAVGAVALCGVAATLALVGTSNAGADHGIKFYGDDLQAPKT